MIRWYKNDAWDFFKSVGLGSFEGLVWCPTLTDNPFTQESYPTTGV
jgi:hypothetical protein